MSTENQKAYIAGFLKPQCCLYTWLYNIYKYSAKSIWKCRKTLKKRMSWFLSCLKWNIDTVSYCLDMSTSTMFHWFHLERINWIKIFFKILKLYNGNKFETRWLFYHVSFEKKTRYYILFLFCLAVSPTQLYPLSYVY